MKAILNPRFWKNTVTVIEDSSGKENLQAADEYYHEEEKTLAEIRKELLYMPSLSINLYKGKEKLMSLKMVRVQNP